MEINKLTSNLSNQVNGTKSEAASEASSTSKVEKSSKDLSDKVSLSNNGAQKSEELFAKVEMEKLNESSFDKVKEMKVKLQAYEQAKGVSDEAANNTEIGKMLNDPEVWGKIAENLIDK
ncbi:hypothetical protein ACKGJO_05945 [Gracilimonas sp. Q87]|uniref:hypothetical protein n=1 Tax=Gracilimonas sp. Q87 TaxID=3384766 RepID=UPI0039843447